MQRPVQVAVYRPFYTAKFFKNVVDSYFNGHEHDVLTSSLVKLMRY